MASEKGWRDLDRVIDMAKGGNRELDTSARCMEVFRLLDGGYVHMAEEEKWERVKAGAEEVEYLEALDGEGEWTALYRVKLAGPQPLRAERNDGWRFYYVALDDVRHGQP